MALTRRQIQAIAADAVNLRTELMDLDTESNGTGCRAAVTVQPPIRSTGASADDATPHQGNRTIQP